MARSTNAHFWSRILAENGLESPGREEAVRETLAAIQAKKMKKEEDRKEKKTKRKK
jgi:hypothetical protein